MTQLFRRLCCCVYVWADAHDEEFEENEETLIHTVNEVSYLYIEHSTHIAAFMSSIVGG